MLMVPLDNTGRRRRHRSESFSLLITNSGTPITKIPHTDDETIVAIVVVAATAVHCVTPFKLASVSLVRIRDATATAVLPSL